LQLRTEKGLYDDYSYDDLRANLGAGKDQAEYLKEISPLYKADDIRIPVLLCGGRDDRIVSIYQSYRLARKLRKAGNKPETFYKVGEMHGFRNEKNKVAYYKRVLSFLEKYL